MRRFGLLLVVGVAAALWPAAASARTANAQFSGRITAADGTPITAYSVCAYAYSYDENASPNSAALAAVRPADAGGTYVLTGLSAGTYVVGFADCHGLPGADAPQYAPGVASVSSAHQYVLAAGESVTGVDARLQPGTSISGRVTAASDGHPLGGICVDATTLGAVSGPLAPLHAVTAPDGSYSLSHLPVIAPAGNYWLTFTDCNAPRVYLAQTASAPVSPTAASPATGVDTQLQVGAAITGRVTDAHGRPVTSRDVCVSAEPSDYLHRGPPNTYDSAKTDGTGRYQLGGLSGDTYNVKIQDCVTNANVRRGMRNDATVLERVTIAGGQTTARDEQLTPGATIRGHVYAGAGTSTPVAGACVQVTTPESVQSTHAPFLDETVRTDRSGGYAIGHLAASSASYVGGGWLVSFSHCTPPYGTTWYDGVSDVSQATPLRLTAGQTIWGVTGHLAAARGARGSLLARSMLAVLHRLERRVATAARRVRQVGPWRLPWTSAGTWSLQVTASSPRPRRRLVVFRGVARLRRPGRAWMTLRVTRSGRAWLRSASARRSPVRLHALLTFRSADRGRPVSAWTDLTARTR